MEDLAKRMKYVLRFYNRLTGQQLEDIGQIPTTRLAFIMRIPYESIVAPFLIEENLKGKGRPHLSEKYNLTERKVRGVIAK